MARIKIFRRGQEPIIDTLHFEVLHEHSNGTFELCFQNISHTAELRRVTIQGFNIEKPYVTNERGPVWIPIQQQQPDYDQEVLFCIKCSHWEKSQIKYGHRIKTDAQGEHYSVDLQHCITHWMPLPEPPHEYVEKSVSPLSVPYPDTTGSDVEKRGTAK